MPSLKDLKNRIASVKSTQKITKAMKMVAASKLRRAQESAEAARPYAERIDRMLASVTAGGIEPTSAPRLMTGTGKDDVHLVIVATAERGLCGGFNSSIAKGARKHIDGLLADGKTVKILTVGRKGRTALKGQFGHLFIDHVDMSGAKRVEFGHAKRITDTLSRMFDAGDFDVATIFYNAFKSVMTQETTSQQLIPVKLDDAAGGVAAPSTAALYEFEPDEAGILAELLPRNLTFQVYQALLENAAGEQGARMTAMDNATRNAGEMIDKLTLVYNRSRQAAITKELIEIISGAEAV